MDCPRIYASLCNLLCLVLETVTCFLENNDGYFIFIGPRIFSHLKLRRF